ncbi:MAG: hypothetical protein WB588_03335 [Dehalococcoidia bacterium]
MRNYIFLAFILLLAFCISFIPHIGYAYPLHVDEWMHMTYAETIAQTGSITFPDPFTGLTNINLGDNLWVGYHILWAMFQQVSGIDWITLFRYFPSIIFMITVLAVYVLASRQGYGLEAAFFTCLIPTTGGLLGPAFMVPMALAMLFIPLSLFLAFNIKTWPAYLLIFLFTCFLLISHATTAILLCILLLPYILLNIKSSWQHSIGILMALAIPFILSAPWIYKLVLQSAGRLFSPQYVASYVEIPDLMWKYGLLPIIFSFIGTVILIFKGGKRNLSLIMGLALLLLTLLIFVRFHFGLTEIYERGLMAMLLILSILAGAGLLWLMNVRLPDNFFNRNRFISLVNSANTICVVLIVVVLAVAIPTRFNAVFYHMIDDKDYGAFAWIKENTGTDYTTALLDPWKATAFTAISSKNVSSRIWTSQEQIDNVIYEFLLNGCMDTTFLRDLRGTLVYNLSPCQNSDLVEVNNNIYITNPNVLSGTGKSNILRNAGFEAIYGQPPLFWSTYMRNCTATFIYPEPGRLGGSSAGIHVQQIGPSNQPAAAVWFQHVPVQAGVSYVISGWVRTQDIAGRGGAMIVPQWKGPDYSWISASEFMPDISGNNGWTYYEGKVVAPEGASFCGVSCLMEDCIGSAWFDDIVFRQE